MSRLYLHIGMHKTGTTFLQREVYPRWQGITYIPRDNLEVILRADPENIRLLSREGLSGQNWDSFEERDKSIRRLATLFPDARILISFRRHASYITSSYNHYVQRGGTLAFEQFFDFDHDLGLLKRDDFLYMERIRRLEQYFSSRPFVFFFEETFSSLERLLKDMQCYIGGTPPEVDTIQRRTHNPSVGYYPLRLLRHLNSIAHTRFNPDGKLPLYHWRIRRLGLDPRTICQYWLRFLPNRPIMSAEQSAAIDEYYVDDWSAIQEYAMNRGTLRGCEQD